MKQLVTTEGILLKRTWLANDDAVLDIFTRDLGRVTVFAGKLARSKKRQLELDFFRLLDLELESGRTAYKLRGVSTKKCFTAFQKTYEVSQHTFTVFENLRKTLPEEKVLPDFYRLSVAVLSHFDADRVLAWLAFWEVKALIAAGMCPRFDQVRDDFWWRFESYELYDRAIDNGVKVSNLTRQVLEWFRRAEVELVDLEGKRLPAENIEEAFSVLQSMAQFS